MMMISNNDALNSSAKKSRVSLVSATAWTIAAYGTNSALRAVSSIILAKLLSPELFGIMLIVFTLRAGFELISDVGIGQNTIYNKNAEDPDFYNTAWSLQVLRGFIIWIVCAIVAAPLARFYHSPILIFVLPSTALVSVLIGAASISIYLIRKRLLIARFSIFEVLVATISTIAQIVIAYISPTIWALVLGNIVGSAVTAIGSYFLLPDLKLRFMISKKYAREIFDFGKWIYITSFVYFLSVNFDRLYLGKFVPMALLGVYGIARNISDILSTLVLQVSNVVVFPFVASRAHMPRNELRKELAPVRLRFLIIAAFGLSLLASTADLIIHMFYDQRYQDAGWMTPILIVGVWFSILSTLNEAILLGLGKPNYGAAGNALKFAFLFFGLTLGVTKYGIAGGVVAVAVVELFRYLPLYVGQVRERFSFGMQDSLLTLTFLGLIAILEYLRHALGFSTSFDAWLIESLT